MHLLQFNQINKLYDNISDKKGIESIDGILKYLNVKLDFDEKDLKKLPANGSFITVSNHPYGGIDGILLIKLLSMARADHKVIANFLLKKVEPISDYFLAVNPIPRRFLLKLRISRSILNLVKRSPNRITHDDITTPTHRLDYHLFFHRSQRYFPRLIFR